MMHRDERRSSTSKRVRETEAEAVAFVVCTAIGLETGTAAQDYIGLYGGEAKKYELLKDPDIEFMNHAKQCFAGEVFESAFKDWKAARLTQKDLVAVLGNRARRSQEIEFKTYLLSRDYSSFGQNSAITGKTALKSGSPSDFPHGFPHLFP